MAEAEGTDKKMQRFLMKKDGLSSEKSTREKESKNDGNSGKKYEKVVAISNKRAVFSTSFMSSSFIFTKKRATTVPASIKPNM